MLRDQPLTSAIANCNWSTNTPVPLRDSCAGRIGELSSVVVSAGLGVVVREATADPQVVVVAGSDVHLRGVP
jgi:hypothetical protein